MTPPTTPRSFFEASFDIPGPVAAWVLAAHFLVLAAPLALIWAVDVYAVQLSTPIAYPTLVKLAAAIYVGAIAFEVAQNSADRWYLTATTPTVADLFFNAFMTLAFCLYTIGFYANFWMTSIAVVCTLLYPLAYIKDHPSHRGLSGVVMLLATLSLYLVTGDPTVFLFLSITGLGMYFILLLMRQHNQWMHGNAAFFFGVAFLTWPWAIRNAALGQPNSWVFVIAATAAIALVAAVLRPWFARLPATPRLKLGSDPKN